MLPRALGTPLLQRKLDAVQHDRVLTQALPLGERLGAHLADERPLARVQTVVRHQVGRLWRLVAAEPAEVRQHPDVRVADAVAPPHVASLAVTVDRLSGKWVESKQTARLTSELAMSTLPTKGAEASLDEVFEKIGATRGYRLSSGINRAL